MSDGFFEALETLKALEPPPDHIIVEASGVADVHNLAQYGHGQGLQLAGIVVLADAETIRQKANDKYVAQTVRRQLQAADIIVLNKTDLCSPEQLAGTARWLAELAPNTPLIQTSRGRVPLSILLSIRPGRRPGGHLQHQDHEQYTSWSWQASYPITRHQLEQFLHHLPDSTIRAKGLFASTTGDTLELQAVGGRREIYQRPEARADCELVAIGLSGFMQPQALDRLASRFLSTPS